MLRMYKLGISALALCVLLFLGTVLLGGQGGASSDSPLVEASALRLAHSPSSVLAAGVASMCAGRSAGAVAAAAGAASGASARPAGDTPSSVFSRIYSTLRWSADGGGSGSGSTMSSTATLRAFLEMLVYRHHIVHVLDAPCGSSHWWPELLARVRRQVPCFTYSGVDVVASVVSASQAAYAGDPLTSFQVADLAAPGVGAGLRAGASASASGPFDLALCRDALQHLPMALAVGVLQNLGASGARLIALGSYLEERANHEIALGDYYKINLLLPPFLLNASHAVDVLNEASRSKEERKYMLLFTGEYIASLDFEAMQQRVMAFTGKRKPLQ